MSSEDFLYLNWKWKAANKCIIQEGKWCFFLTHVRTVKFFWNCYIPLSLQIIKILADFSRLACLHLFIYLLKQSELLHKLLLDEGTAWELKVSVHVYACGNSWKQLTKYLGECRKRYSCFNNLKEATFYAWSQQLDGK